MQTFLPYPSFLESAEVLDKKRCWKQVIEAHQIIQIHEGKQSSWAHHPAVKMWTGHVPELKFYFNCFLGEVIVKHKIKTEYKFFEQHEFYPRAMIHDSVELEYPWWLGNTDFHMAMRARLIVKNREFYLPLFPAAEGFNNGKYFWPDMETRTFKII